MHLLSNVTKAYEWGSLAAIPSLPFQVICRSS